MLLKVVFHVSSRNGLALKDTKKQNSFQLLKQ
jgi:hypothetical protein